MEPLKNFYNQTLLNNLANEIEKQHALFDKKAFKKTVFDNQWEHKELKQRMRHIAESLHQQRHRVHRDLSRFHSVLS